jgi:hypothetical protein
MTLMDRDCFGVLRTPRNDGLNRALSTILSTGGARRNASTGIACARFASLAITT